MNLLCCELSRRIGLEPPRCWEALGAAGHGRTNHLALLFRLDAGALQELPGADR
jgi:hypothetical protein